MSTQGLRVGPKWAMGPTEAKSVLEFAHRVLEKAHSGSEGLKQGLRGPKCLNTASHKKGTTSRVANSEFKIFCYWVMGPYE